jgi:hypothetical protein
MAEMEMLNVNAINRIAPTASSDRSYKFSDDTLRDTSTKYLTGALSALGMSDDNALRVARDFTGRTDMDDIGQSLGVLDFTPAGLVYGVDEAIDQFQAAEKPTDYIAPTVGLGLSAVEAFPVTKIMTKQLRGFLKNLGNKAVSDAPVDMSRRKVVQGIAAAPVAVVGEQLVGSLGNIPKAPKGVPLTKAQKILPKDFSISSLKTFRKAVSDAKNLIRREYRNYDPEGGRLAIQRLEEDIIESPAEVSKDLIDSGDIDIEDSIRELKSKYSGVSDKEILNLFPKGSVNINKIKAIDPNKKFDYLKSNDNLEKAEKELKKLRDDNPNKDYVIISENSKYSDTGKNHIIYDVSDLK